MLLANLLDFTLRDVSVRLIDSKGTSRIVGRGDKTVCTVRVNNRWINQRFFKDPTLYVPEAFMEGQLTIEDGTLYDFLEACSRNYSHLENHPLFKFKQRFDVANFGQYNPIGKAQKNVAHHYDLSDALYALFLDRDRQYSCGYFTDDGRDLEFAQLAKKRHIAAKLLLEPGQSVLDIGCGWGGLGLYLSRAEDINVTGITLSTEQHGVARRRAQEDGLADRASFEIRDYREQAGPFDRIVSVGMFEHVGKRHYAEFFETVRDLLAEDGVMLLHAIGRSNTPSPINPFIRKYIFPGADLPSLSEVVSAIEPTGLYVTDVEILRLHYAETLRQWRLRFMANRDEAAKIYDERFCRMWELYLILCELGFRHQKLMVFQIQLARQLDTVPLTREYMIDWERRQQAIEGKKSRSAA
jgi:cyclopropane-fatty-acyl-phospholipid synthase